MITILGIDPGYGTIGYGVVRFDNMKFTPDAVRCGKNRS